MTQRDNRPDGAVGKVEKLVAEIKHLRERVATLKDKKEHLERRLEARDARIAELLAERRARNKPPAGPVDYTRRLLGRKGHPRVSTDELRRIESELAGAGRDDVTALFPNDSLLANFVLNIWEWAHGVTQLVSLPWNISLPISDVCRVSIGPEKSLAANASLSPKRMRWS